MLKDCIDAHFRVLVRELDPIQNEVEQDLLQALLIEIEQLAGRDVFEHCFDFDLFGPSVKGLTYKPLH